VKFGFEEKTAAASPWKVQVKPQGQVIYNVRDEGNKNWAPHSGNEQLRIAYEDSAPTFEAWINVPITLCANTVL